MLIGSKEFVTDRILFRCFCLSYLSNSSIILPKFLGLKIHWHFHQSIIATFHRSANIALLSFDTRGKTRLV
jgi:hypothetical protein